MRRSLAALGLSVIGIAASIASLIDYLGASPTFCAETGCATVRESAWSHPLGVPMPLLGIAFFAAAIALGFVERPRLRRVLAIAGGAWAVLLIALQAFDIGAWCKLCMVADPAAIGYAIAVLAGARAVRFTLPRALAAVPAVGAAVALLALWTQSEPPPPPRSAALAAVAAAASARSPWQPLTAKPAESTAATIVEVVDFECPFCREMQKRLTTAIAQAGKPVHIIRKMMPLKIHPHAMTAAIAYCCADAQGKGEEMAAALFAAEPKDLTASGCEKLAAQVGCDLDRYHQDLASAKARVQAESAQADADGVNALPTLYIAGEQVVGASKTTEELVALLQR